MTACMHNPAQHCGCDEGRNCPALRELSPRIVDPNQKPMNLDRYAAQDMSKETGQ